MSDPVFADRGPAFLRRIHARAFLVMHGGIFCKKSAHFKFLIQKGLPIYCASCARVYININSHRAPVFFGRRHLVTAPPELRHRFTAIDRLAVTERGKVQSPCDLMPRAERRVRPNIQQMRPKTRGDVGLRGSCTQADKTLPRVSCRAKANAALACRPKSFCGGLRAR